MDADRARIQADLGGVLDGQVHCDDLTLQMYASDASIYEVRPQGVVRPLNVNDVKVTVKYAAENELTIIPRGSGSNVAGCCVGDGLIMDFSYSMRRLQSIARETVTVEPGIVLADLNHELKSHGRMLKVDLPTRSVSTIGGILSRNSSGSHWIKNGIPADKVVSLEMVTADGEHVKFKSPRYSSIHSANFADEQTWNEIKSQQLVKGFDEIIQRNQSLIDAARPDTKVNQAGYNLFDVHGEDQLDVTRLICGSEGTLGIITRATLVTEPPPRHRGVSLLFFHELDSAVQASIQISEMDIVACDLLDRRLLSLARENHQRFRRFIPPEAEAMLLVEFQGPEDREVRQKIETLEKQIYRVEKLAFDVRSATQKKQRDEFWRLTRRIIPTLYRLKGTTRALPFIEDVSIPLRLMPKFIRETHQLLNEYEVTASIFAHTPQGLIHIRPFLNMADPTDLQRMSQLAVSIFELTTKLGGTITSSDGDGLSRSWYLRRQFGELYKVFQSVKDLFDPVNTFNPGKIVGHPYSGLTDNLRRVLPKPELVGLDSDSVETPELQPEMSELDNPTKPKTKKRVEKRQKKKKGLPILQPELSWDIPQIGLAARTCNGCGRCRTSSPAERMCPIFRISPREEATPRAKANLMRGIINGDLELQRLTQEEFKQVTELCVNCHQCRLECPASVDVPKLMVEAKAQYAAVNGQDLSDWALTRLDWLYGLASKMPRLSNWIIRTRTLRWIMSRVIGIAPGRKLPEFAQRSLLKWASRNKFHLPQRQAGRKVVFFVDAYPNWNDTELGQAFVEVLKHNNIAVLIPLDQSVSGMSLISEGSIARARRIALRNVEWLAEYVRQGYEIVTTEPSAALALKHEYLNLIDEDDARLVAENTFEACGYLLNLHHAGQLELDFSPINASIGYHTPCHQRALSNQTPALELLRLIPGLRVDLLEKGCSGMAGTYGLKRKNYNRSLRMGMPLINAVRQPTIVAGATECSACKIQMEQGTTKPTIHPLKIMALAYGKMPQLKDLFERRSEELVVT